MTTIASIILVLSVHVCLVSSQFNRQLLPYEPIQYIKSHIPSDNDAMNVWEGFLESSPQEAADITSQMKTNLKAHLSKSATTVLFARGERILVQRRTSSMKLETPLEVPFANVLSMISIGMPILLENFQFSLINDPMGKVLKGDDRNQAIVRDHKKKSFLDILNKLPGKETDSVLDSETMLTDLDKYGQLGVFFANTVLEKAAKEAWMDALMALGIENMSFSKSGRLELSLNLLHQYALSVLHEYDMMRSAPDRDKIELDDGKYLFGWWFNCPKNSKAGGCLFPELPEDMIFTLSPTLRLYLSPGLELTMIVTDSGKKTPKTVRGILEKDRDIWKQLYSVISADGLQQSDASDKPEVKREASDHDSQQPETIIKEKPQVPDELDETSANISNKESSKEKSDLVQILHWLWPPFVFVFWVLSSHVWVYWMLHCCWLVISRLFKRTHIPRPSKAADAR